MISSDITVIHLVSFYLEQQDPDPKTSLAHPNRSEYAALTALCYILEEPFKGGLLNNLEVNLNVPASTGN